MTRNFTRAAAGLILAAGLSCAQSGPLRAGAAKVDITPTPDMFPIAGPQTYGSSHDPVFARALVLDNGGAKVAMISIDTAQFPPGNEIPDAVAAELHIPVSRLILNATHDHNTPTQGSRSNRPRPGDVPLDKQVWFPLMKRGIIEAAREANANLQPARIGFGRGRAYVNTNRDEKIGEKYGMGYNPDGPSDKTVVVLTITKATGELIAIYANYAVHGVVMYRAKTLNNMVQMSGDLPGWTSRYVEDHFPGAVALWTPGAAGDQNPIFQADYNQDAPDVHDEGAAGWAILDVLSRRLGEEIVRVAKATQNTTDRAVLWSAQTSITCPARTGGPFTIPLALVMINDIALTGVSGEVFTEIGEHVKKDSLFDRTFMVTLLPNDVGYIPNDRAYQLPAMMAANNRLAPGCAEPAMVSAFQSMMREYLPVWKSAGNPAQK
jgi:hypothetical protein